MLKNNRGVITVESMIAMSIFILAGGLPRVAGLALPFKESIEF